MKGRRADSLPFGVDRNLGTELVDQIVGNISLAIGNGVRPQEDWRSGLWLRRDKFENQVNGMEAK